MILLLLMFIINNSIETYLIRFRHLCGEMKHGVPYRFDKALQTSTTKCCSVFSSGQLTHKKQQTNEQEINNGCFITYNRKKTLPLINNKRCFLFDDHND